MNDDVLQKLEQQQQTLDELRTDIKQAKRYFMVSLWVMLALFVLPLLLGAILIPVFLNTYLSGIESML